MEKKSREKRNKRPINKKKLIQNIIVIVLALAMVLSVAATLIYAITR